MRLIPAIDLIDGRCVRLLEGDFDARTEYAVDPVELALEYAEAGARWIHVVDLDGARDGERRNAEVIRRIVDALAAAGHGRVQLGGGIRNAGAISDALALGVGRVVIGSAAIAEPQLLFDWLDTYDASQVVLAVDVRIDENGTPWPFVKGWTARAGVDLWALLGTVATAGLRHLLCTDISRDGTLAGPNVPLYETIRDRYPGMCIQSSGGVGNVEHLQTLEAAGVDAAITGKALLDGRISLTDVQRWLAP